MAHGAAFCVVAAIAAIIPCPYYAIFEHDTDSPSAVREVYLTAVVIAGGVGPGITLVLFRLVRLASSPGR